MAALVADQPSVRATFNLTPVLMRQLTDYCEGGASDDARERTLNRELFAKLMAGEPFSAQELRDVQMWFNLAWFGQEFREGNVQLVTGETASVQPFIERQRDFSVGDIQEMVAEQFKILRAVVPIHKALQDAGNIEVSTTPFYHPILPLLVDTDRATVDRPGTSFPRLFAGTAVPIRVPTFGLSRRRSLMPGPNSSGPGVLTCGSSQRFA